MGTVCKRCDVPVRYDEVDETWRDADGGTGCADFSGDQETWKGHDPKTWDDYREED